MPVKASFAASALAGTLAMAASTGHAAAAWPEMPDPPRSHVEWVAQDMKVDGLPARIEHFDSELTPDEVLGFYRARWLHNTVGEPKAVASGGWQGLSTLQGTFQLVVQVRAKKPQGSEGMLSVANFGDVRKDALPSGWPHWSDVRTTQVTESSDGPKRSVLVSMVSSEGFELNVRRWRDEWQRRGFGLLQEMPMPEQPGLRGWMASFDKAPQSADVVVAYKQNDRRTYISVNLVGPAPGWRP